MSANKTPVVFTGRTSEYFGIWIVNLLLSIITLGIYSAWAKVRRKKYFYNNTLIDGVGFDYHANPVAILKGRIIAFVLYLVFVFASQLHPAVSVILSILLFIAIPWIVVRGLKFNARNSSHRGLRFDFDGQYKDAAILFLGYPIIFGSAVGLVIWGLFASASGMVAGAITPLIIMAALAFYVPFIMQRQQQFMVNHHQFGTTHFNMQAKIKDFFLIFLKLFLTIALLSAAVSMVLALAFKDVWADLMPKTSLLNQPAYVQAAVEPNQGGFIKVAANAADPANPEALIASPNTLTAEEQANLAAQEKQSAEYIEEDLSDEELRQGLNPEDRAEYNKLLKEYEAQAADESDIEWDAEDETGTESVAQSELEKALGPLAIVFGSALGGFLVLGGILLYLAIIFSFVAYIKSRVSNLVLNTTSIDHVGFYSNQRMRDLLWIYVTNALVLMLTGGFATPWAQIRLAKYRADHLSLTGETDWDKFIGEKKEAAKATGEEIADFFDVDLSFGF